MPSPFTVAKVPVTVPPVSIVKVSPMAGVKLLISEIFNVPPRLIP